MLSASEAAKQVGITKQGLMKAIREGRLSAQKDANGAYQIDPAELFRVYTPVNREKTPSEPLHATTEALQIEILEKEIELLKERLRDKDEEIRFLRDRLNQESDERTKLTAILTVREEQNRIPFWKRLLG